MVGVVLVERYALYAVDRGRVRRGEVHHLPWVLHDARVEVRENTMTAPLGIALEGPPTSVLSSPGVDTVVWSLAPTGPPV